MSTDLRTGAAQDALTFVRRALATTDDALGALAALEQQAEQFETVVLSELAEPQIWEAMRRSQHETRAHLFHARGCLEEMAHQIAAGQAPELQTRAWADQFVELYGRVQQALTEATQQATQSYEVMRPSLIEHYLQHATRAPRWSENWPFDGNVAADALKRFADQAGVGITDPLDLQLARLRWEVGWPQQRIAAIVGLSQPSVAARLVRVETLISLDVALRHVRDQAAKEALELQRAQVMPPRGPRGPVGEVIVQAKECTIQMEIVVAPTDPGSTRRGGAPDRGTHFDYYRLLAVEGRQKSEQRTLHGVGVYFRDRGVVGYYLVAHLASALRQRGRLSAESLFEGLGGIIEPAWTLGELLERDRQQA